MNTRQLPPVLTLDGPSGSGKGSVGKLLAERLGWHYLDSGALYRVLAYRGGEKGVAMDASAGLIQLIDGLDIQFKPGKQEEPVQIWLSGRDVTDEVRGEDIGRVASKLAVEPTVRRALLEKQRLFRRPPGLVADGRDMGTAVFVDAFLKVFLTASPDIRAQRRYKQLKEKGFDVNLPRLVEEIRERDARDASRAVSPLTPADDAFFLDTSSLTLSEVVERVGSRLGARAEPG